MKNVKKTAVVYDKWLSTLGGGEVVACNIAKILKDLGYQVTFISGKKISSKLIYKKLNIDLSGIKFIEVWNDEDLIKKNTSGKDLFINCSFMDYSYGYAKKNIYYTHFPTEAYIDFKGMIFNNFILPLSNKIIKPIEFINGPKLTETKFGQFMYLLGKNTKIAFSHLDNKKIYLLKFTIFFEIFYKRLIENFSYNTSNTKIINKNIKVNHHNNTIDFFIKIKPKSTTIYLNLLVNNYKKNINENRIYLINPKILDVKIPDFILKILYEKIKTRLRAGLFINILNRLKTYQLILANSEFTQKWIKKYWNRKSTVIYPPVEMLFEKYNLYLDKFKNLVFSIIREKIIIALESFKIDKKHSFNFLLDLCYYDLIIFSETDQFLRDLIVKINENKDYDEKDFLKFICDELDSFLNFSYKKYSHKINFNFENILELSNHIFNKDDYDQNKINTIFNSIDTFIQNILRNIFNLVLKYNSKNDFFVNLNFNSIEKIFMEKKINSKVFIFFIFLF